MFNSVTRKIGSVGALIIGAILVLILIGILLYLGIVNGAAIYIGMVIVLAVGILLVLLSIMSSVFAGLNLADPKQALGLPEGSIRALIALILLMVFIVVGIHLFHAVADDNPITLSNLTKTEIDDLGTRVIYFRETKTLTNPKTYNVTVRTGITDDGARLAQQLITTIGTLVVAVAGFYFGTSTVMAARGVAVPSLPVIRDIDRKEGTQGEELHLKISGKNFRLPKTVRLVRGSDEIVGTGVLSSDTEVQCKIKIPSDAPANTKWDLIVVNEDDGEDRLADVFVVNPSASSTTTTNT